jgi:alpha-N-arabinofuranosidase
VADLVEYITSPSHSALAEERRANGRAEPWKLRWLAMGNETWGCGGNMRPEYYADLVRQYATFVRVPDERKPKILASGANSEDYNWTKVLMSRAGQYIDAYSLHYYTLPEGDWSHKGPATGFGEKAWIETLSHALKMEELVRKHSAIMDKYDPKRRVALAVDEWGNWYDPEPGTNPAFLVQQNTLRDALTAAINIDIFVHHADRVRMANIAQMVNVLQAMILTDGPRMVLTPTYYVFQMYQPFQDATALPLTVNAPAYRFGSFSVPGVYAAAARGKDGLVHVALANLDPHRVMQVTIQIDGLAARSVDGQVLTADAMDAANTFAAPDRVKPAPFGDATLGKGTLTATLPAKSVVMLNLR